MAFSGLPTSFEHRGRLITAIAFEAKGGYKARYEIDKGMSTATAVDEVFDSPVAAMINAIAIARDEIDAQPSN